MDLMAVAHTTIVDHMGNVTVQTVSAAFLCSATAVAIAVWIMDRFATKAELDKQDKRIFELVSTVNGTKVCLEKMRHDITHMRDRLDKIITLGGKQ